jgi:hypothetical protein
MCVKTEKFEPLFLTKNDVDNKSKETKFLSKEYKAGIDALRRINN